MLALKKLIAPLAFTAGMLTFGFLLPTSAHAIIIGINENTTPRNGATWGATEVGWFYTPTTSFNLTSIETRFGSVSAAKTVTFELRSTSGGNTIGNIIQSGTLNASTSFTAATITPALLDANTTYFLGFRNVGGLGNSITADSGAQSLGVLRYSFDNNGTYASSETGVTTQPILRLNGTAAAVVPEANTAALLGFTLPMIGTVVVTRRRKK